MTSNRLAQSIRFFFLAQRYYWKDFLVYRAQAVVWALYSLINFLFSYVAITVIYNVSSGISGWSYFQMLFLVSTASLVFGTINYVLSPDWINQLMRRGGMDTRLIRPYGRATIYLSAEGSLSSIVSAFGAFVVLIYSAFRLGLGPAPFIGYLLLLAIGTVTLTLMLLMLIVAAYVVVRGSSAVSRMLSFMSQASSYPLPVYGIVGQLIFTLVIPIGVASYYPSELVLTSVGALTLAVVLLVSVAISTVSYLGFNRLMRHYTSGGG
ncbi:MAG: ABC-2 family transporter protein [Candidatus Micrarchaeota archaeon]|nr:ABC-2 family transporter protein [Candidatus Micrarchaeota archaeon]